MSLRGWCISKLSNKIMGAPIGYDIVDGLEDMIHRKQKTQNKLYLKPSNNSLFDDGYQMLGGGFIIIWALIMGSVVWCMTKMFLSKYVYFENADKEFTLESIFGVTLTDCK